MTKWTDPLPRTGARVHFARVDTRACSKWTAKWTASEREVDSDSDSVEVDTLHARKVDKERAV